MTVEVKATCPNCEQPIESTAEAFRAGIDCPSCGKRVSMPKYGGVNRRQNISSSEPTFIERFAHLLEIIAIICMLFSVGEIFAAASLLSTSNAITAAECFASGLFVLLVAQVIFIRLAVERRAGQ